MSSLRLSADDLVGLLCLVAAIAGAILRALAVDEVRGRIQRHARRSVQATIDSLPPAAQAEWGDEWIAELEAMISMPFTALAFARGVRESASRLAAASPDADAVPASESLRGRAQGAVLDQLIVLCITILAAAVALGAWIGILAAYLLSGKQAAEIVLVVVSFCILLLAIAVVSAAGPVPGLMAATDVGEGETSLKDPVGVPAPVAAHNHDAAGRAAGQSGC